MPAARLLCLTVLALALQPGAQSLEPSASVKASPVLKTSSSWNGQPLAYPEGQAEISALVIEIAPDGETGWHLHTVPSFALVLEGELDVQLKDGAVKRVKPGEAFAEVVNTLHNGRNVGAAPARLVVFYASTVGQTVTVKE